MSLNGIDSSGPVAQNTIGGNPTQCSNTGSGTQINHNYGGQYRDHQAEEDKKARAEKQACLKSLAFDVIHARRDDIAPSHRDTCDWLFSTPEFREWQRPVSFPTHNGVFWIKGKPGAGKSTLMKHAYLRYQKEFFCDHLIVAYFFNARGETLEKTPLGMLRSIVYQLLNDDTLYEYSLSFIREKRTINKGKEWKWRESELKQFIRAVVQQPPSRPLLFLIDALDECDESEVRDVVEFLEKLSDDAFQADVRIRICLSSRHYPQIGMDKVLELTVETSKDHQTDIAKYVRDNLRVRNSEIEAEIRRKADGLFLWVAIVVSLLNTAYDQGRIEAMWKTLEEIPSSLESMFSTILEKGDPRKFGTVFLLQWVLLSRRPLKPTELFVAIKRSAPPAIDVIQRWITNVSKGLVEIRKDADSVQFIHLSVSDFLFGQKGLQTLDPTLGAEPVKASHGRLWACCWSCIEEVNTAFTSAQHLAELKENDPFLGYAASYVLDHADRALSNAFPDCSYIPRLLSIRRWWREPSRQFRILRLFDFASCSHGFEDPIRQWLREQSRWFQRWRLILITTGSHEERLILEDEAGAGFAYILALRGLLNLCSATPNGDGVNAQGGRYGNALQIASFLGRQEFVRLLLKKGANINAQGGAYGNALQAAIRGEHQETVRLLLKKGACANASDVTYGNALQVAIERGNQDIVRLLLEEGADLNVQGGEYGNALQAACYWGHQEIVRLLLERGANVNAQGGYYGSAMQAASAGEHQHIVQLLLKAGADPNMQSGEYGNALQAASYWGHQEIVRLLLERGANVNAQGGYYDSAMQAASTGGHREIMQLLLKGNADVDIQGTNTPQAFQRGHTWSSSSWSIIDLFQAGLYQGPLVGMGMNEASLHEVEATSTGLNSKHEAISRAILWCGMFGVLGGLLILLFLKLDE